MKTRYFVLVTLISIVSAAQLFAQAGPRWRGSGGWGANGSYSRIYDAKTVETVTGEVVSVGQFTPSKATGYGIHLVLRSDKETLPVHLGPAWFVENQDAKIQAKDKIEVKGSRVTFEGKPALIAAEVRDGDEVLKLRDETGIPAWSGWRRR
jgi:hypothetical protein